jgi:hypothetical protein
MTLIPVIPVILFPFIFINFKFFLSQGSNFVQEELGLFVTDAQPFIAQEQLKVNIKLLCSYAASAQIWQIEHFYQCSFRSFA